MLGQEKNCFVTLSKGIFLASEKISVSVDNRCVAVLCLCSEWGR